MNKKIIYDLGHSGNLGILDFTTKKIELSSEEELTKRFQPSIETLVKAMNEDEEEDEQKMLTSPENKAVFSSQENKLDTKEGK